MALGLKKNDIVWTSPNSFIASANCAEYCGAKVDFVDINFKTGNISTDCFEEKIKKVKKIINYQKSYLCILEVILQIKKNLAAIKGKWNKIIEDASHSLGAKNNKEKVGSCKYSDITITSFHPVKTITTAEGGIALTNSKILFNYLKEYRVTVLYRTITNIIIHFAHTFKIV